MKSGIYQIQNRKNGKTYIGSAKKLLGRFSTHRSTLQKGKHDNLKLQRAWNKYGEENFDFSVVLLCPESLLLFYEQRAIDTRRPFYNINPTAGNRSGATFSLESRQRMSRSAIGKVVTQETRDRMAQAHRGKPSPARGKKWSDEAKARITGFNNSRWGKPLPENVRRKIAIKNRKITQESIDEIRTSAKTHRALAKQFGIGKTTVARIKNGKSHILN